MDQELRTLLRAINSGALDIRDVAQLQPHLSHQALEQLFLQIGYELQERDPENRGLVINQPIRNPNKKKSWKKWVLNKPLGASDRYVLEGAAFRAPKGDVYKITANKNEIELAEYLLVHPNLHPMLPVVFEINTNTGDEGFPLGYRREDLPDFNLLSIDDAETLDFLVTGVSPDLNGAEKRFLENKQHLEAHNIPPTPQVLEITLGILKNLFEIYQKFGITIGDIRCENLGMRGKQIVIRDIGHGCLPNSEFC